MVKFGPKPYSTGNPKQKTQAASASVAISETLCFFDRIISDFNYMDAILYLADLRTLETFFC